MLLEPIPYGLYIGEVIAVVPKHDLQQMDIIVEHPDQSQVSCWELHLGICDMLADVRRILLFDGPVDGLVVLVTKAMLNG